MTASHADTEIWHVLMDTDDMKRMNVDQLADAFRLSLIDASTLVWQGGMEGWRRLGSIADVEDDEPEEIEAEEVTTAYPPPPPPAPRALKAAGWHGNPSYYPPATLQRPQRTAPASYYPQAQRFEQPPQRVAPASYYPGAHNPFDQSQRAAPASYYPDAHDPFEQPELVAPVYANAHPAPDPYVLPRREVALPDTIDFRRAPGSVRWGRWFVAGLLFTCGIVGAYRQNLLREGARRIGIESTYLASERRMTAFASANAPQSVKGVLTRLALLPGPNAGAESEPSGAAAPAAATFAPTKAALPPCVSPAPAAAPSSASEPARPEPAVKTVSFDSLPVLRKGVAEPAETVRASASHDSAGAAQAAEPARASHRAFRQAKPARDEDPPVTKVARKKKASAREDVEAVAKATPKAKPKTEPKAKPEPAPRPPANESFLQAAMRSAAESDAKKLAARRKSGE